MVEKALSQGYSAVVCKFTCQRKKSGEENKNKKVRRKKQKLCQKLHKFRVC